MNLQKSAGEHGSGKLANSYGGDKVMRLFGYTFLAREKYYLVADNEQWIALQGYGQGLGGQFNAILVEDGIQLKRRFEDRLVGGKLLENCRPGDVQHLKTRVFGDLGCYLQVAQPCGQQLLLLVALQIVAVLFQFITVSRHLCSLTG
jgi:hypothetical protein